MSSNNNDDEQDLYDEFGNYIGPDLDEDSDDDDSDDDDKLQPRDDQADSDVSEDEEDDNLHNRELVTHDSSTTPAAMLAEPMQAIVLHEDKEYYPSVDQVYGEDVRTAVLDEDAMELEEPLVKPVSTKTPYATATADATTTTGGVRPLHVVDEQTGWSYSSDYLSAMLSNETTRTRRGVAIVGHLHHGKTTLMDLLLEQTLNNKKAGWGTVRAANPSHNNNEEDDSVRYMDTLKTERERQMSLCSTPMTALLCDTRGKHYGITMMDCPGHVNFHDESVVALRAMDGAVIVVDAVEGIMIHTEMVVRQAIAEGLPLVLVISKMDRLMVELKLPPRDCYYKLLHVIDSMNSLIGQASNGRYNQHNGLLLSPARGNVAFCSATHGWLFTLQSFAQVYMDTLSNHGLGENLSVDDFAKRLWGDSFLDPATRTFQTSPRDCSVQQDNGMPVQRTFCQFVLEPLYKIYTACLGEREAQVNPMLRSVGVLLSKEELRASARPLLRTALSRFLGKATCGFVDMIVKHMYVTPVCSTDSLPMPAYIPKGGNQYNPC
jgi:U5 small nuclear ribonucleoprotein component